MLVDGYVFVLVEGVVVFGVELLSQQQQQEQQSSPSPSQQQQKRVLQHDPIVISYLTVSRDSMGEPEGFSRA